MKKANGVASQSPKGEQIEQSVIVGSIVGIDDGNAVALVGSIVGELEGSKVDIVGVVVGTLVIDVGSIVGVCVPEHDNVTFAVNIPYFVPHRLFTLYPTSIVIQLPNLNEFPNENGPHSSELVHESN